MTDSYFKKTQSNLVVLRKMSNNFEIETLVISNGRREINSRGDMHYEGSYNDKRISCKLIGVINTPFNKLIKPIAYECEHFDRICLQDIVSELISSSCVIKLADVHIITENEHCEYSVNEDQIHECNKTNVYIKYFIPYGNTKIIGRVLISMDDLALRKTIFDNFMSLDSLLNNNDSCNDIVTLDRYLIIDEESSAVFFHEAIGHLFECDPEKKTNAVYERTLKEIVLDCKLNINNNPLSENPFSCYAIDDLGYEASEASLLRNGRFSGFIGETTGNNFSKYFFDVPILRTSNLYVSAGETTTSAKYSTFPCIELLKFQGGSFFGGEIELYEGFIRDPQRRKIMFVPKVRLSVSEVLDKLYLIKGIPKTVNFYCCKFNQARFPVSVTTAQMICRPISRIDFFVDIL